MTSGDRFSHPKNDRVFLKGLYDFRCNSRQGRFLMVDVKSDVVEGEAVATVKQDDVVVGRAREQGIALTGEGGLI